MYEVHCVWLGGGGVQFLHTSTHYIAPVCVEKCSLLYLLVCATGCHRTLSVMLGEVSAARDHNI